MNRVFKSFDDIVDHCCYAWTRSSTSPGKSCPSPAAIGHSPVTHCEGWYQSEWPFFEAPFNNRGNAYNAKGDRDRAIADFDEAIRLNPNNSNAFNNRGSAYNAKGDRDRAIVDYDKAIGINPGYAAAFYNRGNAYYAKGDRDRAVVDYDRAILLNPAFDTPPSKTATWRNTVSAALPQGTGSDPPD